jgi:tRNA(Arg) A34 adenosine deaminase TadA
LIMLPSEISLTVPGWLGEELGRLPSHLPGLEDRMAAVIRFSQLNFERGSGGPFAAGVFERDSGRLVVIGVNRVMANNCSSAHAEIMALSLAQKILGGWDLGRAGLPAHQLVVNWRPCAMCYGAVLWSGVRSLVVAGDGPELEQLTGFDEGPLRDDWAEQLGRRGIAVTNHVLKAEAVRVFRLFGQSGQFVYNARQGV